ncbi:50S ribosomal protein L11 methyltransferase [Aliarcobacter cryaerophilus]|uniref:50S ribosomal protein L11 methyltransferase n=1 Tax=Aliarcobacter cryaerophilus TaxID=28198 RepID=UPI003DA499AA
MSKEYFELLIKPEDNYELFLNLILSLTDDAIEENDGEIIVRSEENLEDFQEPLEKFAKALNTKCYIKCEKKESIDWIKKYQDSIQAVEVGSFYVRPSWSKAKEGKIDILIDPALAFGSGHHETTSSCLLAIDEFVKKGDSLLDVGTGSGILAIAAAKKGAVVDVCDTDEICIESTKSNFALNNQEINKSWIGSVNFAKEKYDVVLANIIADVLVMIADDLINSTKDGGIIIVSGILDKHEKRVLSKFSNLKELKIIHKNEWVTMVFKK